MEDSRVVAGNLIAAARNIATNTEVGQLVDAKDLQLILSRIDTTRPFFVICAKDAVVNQLAGVGTLEFQLSNVRRHRLVPGDIVYIPAGTPHRYLPNDESIQLKYKASAPGAEAVAWYCTRCDSELFRYTFDPASTTVETGYRQGDMAFNVDPGSHTCRNCGLRQD